MRDGNPAAVFGVGCWVLGVGAERSIPRTRNTQHRTPTERRPVALRRSLFRGVAASIRKQLRAASAAWQPCGRRPVDFLRLGPALCVPAFRRVCLFGPGTEEHPSAPLQDTGRRGAELSTERWKAGPALGGTAGLGEGRGGVRGRRRRTLT